MNLKRLDLDELVGVVNLYPWFAGARVELCRRMSRMGYDAGGSQYADAAMYVGAREKLAAIVQSRHEGDLSDGNVEQILKSYMSGVEPEVPDSEPVEKRKVYVVGGDYFSQDEYDKVRDSSDNVFSRYAAKAHQERSYDGVAEGEEFNMYTETLAQIYAEQGYYEQAKHIYSQLILAYPEKSAYFAALIQKLNELN